MIASTRHALRRLSAFLQDRAGVARSDPAPLLLPPPDRPARRIEDSLNIPVVSDSEADAPCAQARLRGMFLARQERWPDLAQQLHEAESRRTMLCGNWPLTELLSFGARSDVVLAVEHALQEGIAADDPILLDGVMGLEQVLREHGNDPMIALVVAQAHTDIAWAWRGTGWDDAAVSSRNRRRCAAHFDRAAAILAQHCGKAMNSPSLLAARCALRAGGRIPRKGLADDYEALIDMAPGNPAHMRALGTHLLPGWFGSYPELELEARRTAARLTGLWGNGGYCWVMLNAIALDDGACALVDVEFFLDGLRDIVAARPDQAMVNYLAAYCAVTLAAGYGTSEEADLARTRICDSVNWLVRDHLTELHPLIWAHAAQGFDNNARVTSPLRFAARGRADAMQVIADLFRDEIAGGKRVTFTPDGPKTSAV
ncbi:hypothetical protein SAMN05444007_102355 [Cribrihabitans marinus]|uniref:Uncharacterized protein n=1 Tax=Cribrihabitans marinus TaxID=1227549 RepID=A0A1H6TFJ4_9RHOB|nr:hypothetical protein [Cribrihabitans marinus]GGH21851.1 hypothetical protein GCM10010973_06710 [Cribrihabitans marinus]SEI78853.1 hypothetical protein SAMN05444007_102355 [Cribrihabitans marinus]